MYNCRSRSAWLAGSAALSVGLALAGCTGGREGDVPNIFTGGNDAAVATARSQFIARLGEPLNREQPGALPSGRREVNLGAVPAGNMNNNTFPGTFFTSPNGITFTTPGTGLRVSDNDLADVNATYPSQFHHYRLLTPIGSNVIDLTFNTPGSPGSVAGTSGLGIGFADVDQGNSTTVQLFDDSGRNLGTFAVPAATNSPKISFFGIHFTHTLIARARVTLGTASIGAGVNDISSGGANDLVVITDIGFGEPQPLH